MGDIATKEPRRQERRVSRNLHRVWCLPTLFARVFLPVSLSHHTSINLFNEEEIDYFYQIAQQIKDGATSYTTPDGEQKAVTASMRKKMEKLWAKLQRNKSKGELIPLCLSYNCGIRYE